MQLSYEHILYYYIQGVKIKNKEKSIAVLGLAFKKDTDDIRESVAIKIVKDLLKKNYRILCIDLRKLITLIMFSIFMIDLIEFEVYSPVKKQFHHLLIILHIILGMSHQILKA